MYELAIGAIIVALIFDFINGFHDAANSIATVVGTRVLKPLHAVSLAAMANFFGPFLFGVAVATTIGKGIIDPDFVTIHIVIAALVGAIVWNLITWWLGLPSSSSHALVGGIIGAGIAGVGTHVILFGGLEKVFTGILVSPLVGLAGAFLLATLIVKAFANKNPANVNSIFGKLQLVSATYFSLTHGANDGQKTMGIIVLILLTEGVLTTFEVPFWVILIAAIAISLGTFFGGWRIVKTMGARITQLKPYQGFAAETSGATILAILAHIGIPASTTHAISGSIMGAGAVRRVSAVRWGIGKRIVWAWIITIPASAAVAFLIMIIIKFFE
ncbi:inorganic phosphate transporter [Candidatus Nitrosarchaeum limnium]|jgi:PiT family inorganic phosphate transporter|uniref:Phosphate transporter family protein n=1 Tax=Candidatus Nitrosarchaeum limnium BG20 TaxID=859192 RepID=S2E5Y9_9ARCH|nr:inorganic phosphate transporter [Candidatus Nitrosarchaeum limnium]EPA06148.1 phosphate transporter family protein [Candidatus Nitrosarchaeum limnium BG20]